MRMVPLLKGWMEVFRFRSWKFDLWYNLTYVLGAFSWKIYSFSSFIVFFICFLLLFCRTPYYMKNKALGYWHKNTMLSLCAFQHIYVCFYVQTDTRSAFSKLFCLPGNNNFYSTPFLNIFCIFLYYLLQEIILLKRTYF